jgi:DNA-binding MarR family transcriptional regulator
MNMTTNALPIQPLNFLKVLAHDLRWQLVSELTQSDYRVQELVDLLQQPQNLVSYHLKQLRSQRLVTEHRSTADARDIYYSLDLASF